MYNFKTELKDEFLDGRTLIYLSNKIPMSNSYLCNILNGKISASSKIAKILCIELNKNIDKYFEKVR